MTITEYLQSLGKTPDEVAMSLRAQGVKGEKLSNRMCPVLNGIYKACPDYWSGLVIVNGKKGEDGHWHYAATLHDAQIMDPKLPEAVMDFIGAFDHGRYPDLEATTVREVRTRVWE